MINLYSEETVDELISRLKDQESPEYMAEVREFLGPTPSTNSTTTYVKDIPHSCNIHGCIICEGKIPPVTEPIPVLKWTTTHDRLKDALDGKAKTEMGRKLMALREKAIAEGMPLLGEEEITGEGMVTVRRDDLVDLLQGFLVDYPKENAYEAYDKLLSALEEKP